jgi:hypothetical protein
MRSYFLLMGIEDDRNRPDAYPSIPELSGLEKYASLLWSRSYSYLGRSQPGAPNSGYQPPVEDGHIYWRHPGRSLPAGQVVLIIQLVDVFNQLPG